MIKKKFLLVIFLLLIKVLHAQNLHSDSLKNFLYNSPDDTIKVNRLCDLAKEITDNNPHDALEIANKALQISNKLNWLAGKAKSHNRIGVVYQNLSDYVQALSHYEKGLTHAKQANDLLTQSRILSNMGLAYSYLSNHLQALLLFQKSLLISEKLADQNPAALVLNNIGLVYSDLNDDNKALEYFNKAYDLGIKLNNKYLLANASLNIGNIYKNKGEFENALKQYFRSIVIADELKNELIIARAYGNIGETCVLQREYEKAIEYYDKALKLARTLGDKNSESIALNNLGNAYMAQGNYEEALDVSKKALQIALALKLIDRQGEAWLTLSHIYEKTNKPVNAIDAFKKYILLRDSSINENVQRDITRKEMQFEFERKESQLKFEQEKKEALQKSETEQQRKLKNIFIVCFIIFLVLVFVLLRQVRLKHTANTGLSDALADLKQMQQQLIHQEKMASLGQLTAGIAHEIQNPLNFVNNFSEISSEILQELKSAKTEEEKNAAIKQLNLNLEKISQHGKHANNIIKSMLYHSRNSSGQRQLTDLNKLCEEFIDLAYHGTRASYPEFNCSIKKEFDISNPKINIIPQEVSRVLLNLFNNSFFALREKIKKNKDFSPLISITTKQQNNYVEINVKDNGVGIPQAIHHKIFQPFFTTKHSGEGTGLGLSLSYDIIKAHNGEIKMESEPGKGTEFNITLPIS